MPLYQNEVMCSAFDMEIIFYSHASKTHFHKKGCALGLILKVRVFGTRKWPIELNIIQFERYKCHGGWGGGGRGRVLEVRAYMERLPQKGVHVLGFRYIEG